MEACRWAWAGPLIPQYAYLLAGIEQDSVSVSAHKLLFQPKVSVGDVSGGRYIDGAISMGGDYLTSRTLASKALACRSHSAFATLLAWESPGLRNESSIALTLGVGAEWVSGS